MTDIETGLREEAERMVSETNLRDLVSEHIITLLIESHIQGGLTERINALKNNQRVAMVLERIDQQTKVNIDIFEQDGCRPIPKGSQLPCTG